MADGVGQLAFISAVLGGFAVTFLALLLTLADTRRHVGAAIGVTIASAASFLISTVGWGLMAFVLAVRSSEGQTENGVPALLAFGRLHEGLTTAFLLGVFLLLTTLGLSGWIRSRRVGLVSITIALTSAAICFAIIGRFILR